MNTVTNVKLQFTNVDTNEVRTIDLKNTNVHHDALMNHGGVAMDKLYLLPTALGKDCPTLKFISNAARVNDTTENTAYASRRIIQGSTWWYERKFRYNATGGAETVRSVCCGVSTADIYGYVVLDIDEIQAPNEVLDVTYRVIYELDMTTHASMMTSLMEISSSLQGDWVTDGNGHLASMPITDNLYDFSYVTARGTVYVGATTNISGGLSIGGSVTELQDPGRLITSVVDNSATANIGTVAPGKRASIPQPLIGPDSKYPNYPLGSLINHSADSSTWYEDLNGLAAGLGSLVVSAPTPQYRTANEADAHVYSITKSGNIGTAKYMIGVLNGAGNIDAGSISFSSQSLYTRGAVNMSGMSSKEDFVTPHKDITTWEHQTLAVPVRTAGWWYNSETFVGASNTKPSNHTFSSESTAFGFHNIVTDKYIHIDAYTTPSISPTTNMPNSGSAYCRNTAGKVFIAIGDQGILAITNVLTGASVNVISKTSIGTSGDITAMAHGYQDRIWYASTTEIGYSDDDGATWTVPASYSFTETVSLSYEYNKLNIASISASPMAHEVAVSYFISAVTPCDNRRSGFYDPATNEVLRLDPFYSTIYKGLEAITCTPRGTWIYDSRGKGGYQGYAKWNTPEGDWPPTVQDGGTSADDGVGDVTTFIDALNNEVVIARNHTTGLNNYRTALMPDGMRIGTMYCEQDNGLTICSGRYDVSDGIPMHGAYGRSTYTNPTDDTHAIVAYSFADITDTYVYDNSANRTSMGALDGLELDKELTQNGDIYRLNAAGTWEANYNAPATATADGSSTADAARVNFSTDSNEFHGRCYLDITPSLSGVNFSSGGMTIVSTYDPVAKSLNPNATFVSNNKYTNHEEIPHVCFHLSDSATGNGLVLYYHSSSQEMMIEETTSTARVQIIQIVSGVAILEESRIVVTLSSDGSSLIIYKNGVQLTAPIALNTSFPMANTSDTITLTVGAKHWSYELNKEYYFNIFKGGITNIQVWNDVWNISEVNSDNANRSGLITAPSNLVSRYLMTATSYGEGKITHTSAVAGPYGVEVDFADGNLSSDSYIKGDWYNVIARKYGLLKDNITKFDFEAMVVHNSSSTAGVISDNAGVTTVPSTIAEITEPANWALVGTNAHTARGSFSTDLDSRYLTTAQSTTGNMEIEVEISTSNRMWGFGITEVGDLSHWVVFMSIKNDGTNEVFIGTDNQSPQPAIVVPSITGGARFKLTYNATSHAVNAFTWNDSTSTWDAVGTTVTADAPTGATVARLYSLSDAVNGGPLSINKINITYTPPCAVMRFGDALLNTGAYRWDSTIMDLDIHDSIEVEIDGGIVYGGESTPYNSATIMHNAHATVLTDGYRVLGDTGIILVDETTYGGDTIVSNNLTIGNKGNQDLV